MLFYRIGKTLKTAMLKRVREGEYNPTLTPSQIIAPHDGELFWLVDKAAAGQ